jgi:glycosyltransferase involved in cell wall biosynthesis
MSAVRLLLVTDAVGGVWVYSLELARALKPLGIDTLLAITGPSPTEQQREQAQGMGLLDTGLPLDWLSTTAGELRRAGDKLAAIAWSEGADIVQTCSAALLADSEFDAPAVAVQHSCIATWWSAVRGTPMPPQFAWRSELVERGLARADAIVAPTGAFAAETARSYQLSRPVLTVHNGRRPISLPPLPQGRFIFTASRLWDEGKNVATLDAAAALVDAPVQAAGPVDGPNDTHVGLEHMHLLGALSPTRMAGLLAARPIFASAALYEPFGLSVLEAAFAGCALILSDIPTHRELWDGAAVFVDARDHRGFAEAMRMLLDDVEARTAFGEAARCRARRYTPERMAQSMAGIYGQLAEQRFAATPRTMAGAA